MYTHEDICTFVYAHSFHYFTGHLLRSIQVRLLYQGRTDNFVESLQQITVICTNVFSVICCSGRARQHHGQHSVNLRKVVLEFQQLALLLNVRSQS